MCVRACGRETERQRQRQRETETGTEVVVVVVKQCILRSLGFPQVPSVGLTDWDCGVL